MLLEELKANLQSLQLKVLNLNSKISQSLLATNNLASVLYNNKTTKINSVNQSLY